MKYWFYVTIGKPDIFQQKSLVKSATDFYQSIRKPERVSDNDKIWLPTYLNFSAKGIRRQYISHVTNSQREYSIYISYRF